MQVENDSVAELSVQESPDHIEINKTGVKLLFGIAIIAFLACALSLTAILYAEKGIGNSGAVAGMLLATLIIQLLRMKKVKLALMLILWGFALIPIFLAFGHLDLMLPVLCAYRFPSWQLVGRFPLDMRLQ